jgi:hypothetical protein
MASEPDAGRSWRHVPFPLFLKTSGVAQTPPPGKPNRARTRARCLPDAGALLGQACAARRAGRASGLTRAGRRCAALVRSPAGVRDAAERGPGAPRPAAIPPGVAPSRACPARATANDPS